MKFGIDQESTAGLHLTLPAVSFEQFNGVRRFFDVVRGNVWPVVNHRRGADGERPDDLLNVGSQRRQRARLCFVRECYSCNAFEICRHACRPDQLPRAARHHPPPLLAILFKRGEVSAVKARIANS